MFDVGSLIQFKVSR